MDDLGVSQIYNACRLYIMNHNPEFVGSTCQTPGIYRKIILRKPMTTTEAVKSLGRMKSVETSQIKTPWFFDKLKIMLCLVR